MTKTKWYQKPLYTLVALALVLSLGIVAVPMAATVGASPGQWYVDDSVSPSGDGKSWGTAFKTITEGITAAGTGDTINVAAGTYNENVGIPAGKDNLQIIGHSNADTFITVGGGIGFDCYCPVTIKGFDISGTARGSGHAFCLRGGSGGTSANPGVFEDNKVHSLNYGMKTGDWDPRPEYWEIKNNDFYDLRLGVLLEHSYHFEISGNTFEDYKEGVTMGYCCDTARYINITDNEFLGTTDTELGAAIVISSQAQDIHVLRNEIRDSIIGVLIKVKDLTCPELVNVNINLNNIVGNAAATGVKNESETDVDATCNWWGDPSGPNGEGPGSGDAVSISVTFSPWLIAPAPGGACVGGLPPLVLKAEAKAELDEIYPTEDIKVDKGLEKAIKHLDKSMDEDLWEDEAHLEVKHGKKVFDEEKKVVKELKKLIDKRDASQYVKDACQLVIGKLVMADGLLARTACDEASGGDPKELEKCDRELEKAGKELGKGHPDKAIDHFKKAWEHAQKAMK